MKKTTKNALRFFGGIILILVGIAIAIMHACKVVPANWESSNSMVAITYLWAMFGMFVGPIVATLGLYVSGLGKYIARKIGFDL